MFYGATSFNQSHLYCNWQSNPFLDLGTGVCGQTVDCGWGDETCPPTNVPTPSPITASTPSSGNGGGGKAAGIYFLYYQYGALLILLNYYIIFHMIH
jgi:hypothetical protein